ncbi:MAG: hypothetical protein L0Z70_09820 [Chloroflexi bacterium]|nr:hypothetical protein [Chloroflexota bacterium]
MNIGMLWFDNDPKTALPTKVERAADYYRKKYGAAPNLCFVHPSMMKESAGLPAINGRIELRASGSVRPNQFWIGVDGSIHPSES